MRTGFAIGMIAMSMLVIPAGADAAQRFASPTGAGTSPCADSNPCSLPDAVSGAAMGDEVVVTPGDYALTATLDMNVVMTLRGVPGQPRPRLLFSGAGQNGVRADSGQTVRFLEIVQNQAGVVGFFSSGSTGDQLIIRGAVNRLANIQSLSTLQNSIVVTSSGSAVVTSTNGGINTSTYRNVTAISTDVAGYGIRAVAAGALGQATVNAFNVIAKGGAGDIAAETDSSGATATVNAVNSNFAVATPIGTNATVPTPGTLTNQSAAPLFVDAAGGDYHQAVGSPTIDAGSALGIGGLLDVDGDARSIVTPDIGADERAAAPVVTTDAANAVDHQSATLNGTVDPRGSATTYLFEYGTTALYAAATPSVAAGSGASPAAVAATISGLAPETTYHYRAVATNPAGTTNGPDQTFTTSATPPPATETNTTTTSTSTSPTTSTPLPTPSTSTPQATTKPFAGVALASAKLRFRANAVRVTLRCPTGTPGGCSGTLTLLARTGTGRAAATLVLGRAKFKAAAGRSVTARVRVGAKGRALLRRSTRSKASLRIAARNGAGQSKTTTRAVTIRR